MLQIVKVKQLIESLLEYLRIDFQNKEKEDTFLYKVLGDTKDGNFDFYEQAKNLYIRTPQNPNLIQVSYECPKDRTSMPAYVVREPVKVESELNSIGKIIDIDPSGNILHRDSRSMNFEIMCFSENMMESILMSEVLYALLLGSYETLAEMFLQIGFTVNEIVMENQMIPNPIFMKTVQLSIIVDEEVPSLTDSRLLGKIIFGKINQEDSKVYDIV